jgi:aminoglycoside phosphotransferase (APT) family kinase protein
MAREYRVMSALQDTDVPVPTTYALCRDEEVLGAPFYVMERVAGTAYRHAAELEPLGRERTRALAIGLVDTLATLHQVDADAVGLTGFGRPEGFLARQVDRWKQQLDASRTRDLPAADELHARLAAEVPQESAPGIVHGDYRLDNVLIGEDDRIKAILDWEMSTLGDPLTDLGLLVMYSMRIEAPDSPVSTTAGAVGHPEPAELIERYAEGSGRDVSGVAWYTAFAWFKLAVILEGIHYRYTLGQTVGAGFDRIGDLVPVFIDNGLTTLQEG